MARQLRRWSARQGWLKLWVWALMGRVRRLPRDPEQLHVLCYHVVQPSHAQRFEATLRRLAAVGRFVSWDEALDILAGRVPANGPVFCLTFDDGCRSWAEIVLPVLVRLRLPAAFFLVTALVDSPEHDWALSWPECRQLVKHGMTVGSHSATHRPLAALSDDDVRGELVVSKAELERRLGVPIRDFCAPFGQPNTTYRPDRDVPAAVGAGYRCFVTTVRGPMRPGDSPYEIRRTVMEPEWSAAVVRGRLRAPTCL